GPFDVRAFEMKHVGVNALGFRIEAGGAVFAYTGDTGPSDSVVEMARGADVLMAEASYQDASNLLPFHLSARQAAEHAKRAGVGRLLLTHIVPTLDASISLAETRSASITGGYIALTLAIRGLQERGAVGDGILRDSVAAVSVGIVGGEPVLDLCYEEDAGADVDANVVMTGDGRLVEVQGTAEGE